MELRQLKHFVALAEEMHFGRAAERLCLSQPALSTSIVRLEEDFGVRLFDRDNKGVRITAAGELMLRYARETINHADRTTRFSHALAAGQVGRIEMGFSGTMLSRDLDGLIRDLHTDLPEIEFYLREITSQRQMELLRAGRLDAGLVSLTLPPVDLEHIELLEDQFVACLPAGHALAGRRAIDITELRDETFILQSRDRAPVMYDQLVSLCTSAGFHPRVAIEAEHLLSLATLVARGFGVGLVPISLAEAGIAGLEFVSLQRPLPRRCWYFVWNPRRETPGLDALIERMQAFARENRGPVQGLRQLLAR
ncbi:MAG TPA: LysR family transcriptional regulator [Ramlibacter sp.]|nr:LysR family transcriptional regulator [Ramlibacter sp.]